MVVRALRTTDRRCVARLLGERSVKSLVVTVLCWLLRVVTGDDLRTVRARLWETALLLDEERERLRVISARAEEKTATYWRRIRDDAAWRDRLHRRAARIEQRE